MNSKAIRGAFVVVVVFSVFVAITFTILADTVADSFGVDDVSGHTNTYVLVPVNITNAQNSPIISIRFDMLYDNIVINVVDVHRGDLTPNWETPSYFNHDWGTRVSLVYDGQIAHAIQGGSTGSVVLLNFSVIGNPGETSIMDFTDIQLSDTGYSIGTAPAKNGTFSVDAKAGSITGKLTYTCNTTGIAGAAVNLTEGSVLASTTTDSDGSYTFIDVTPGVYYVNASKKSFWSNSTPSVTVNAGESTIANLALWLKGDLNNNGISADEADVLLIFDAYMGTIEADYRCDLNENGIYADRNDVLLMLYAYYGIIIFS